MCCRQIFQAIHTSTPIKILLKYMYFMLNDLSAISQSNPVTKPLTLNHSKLVKAGTFRRLDFKLDVYIQLDYSVIIHV